MFLLPATAGEQPKSQAAVTGCEFCEEGSALSLVSVVTVQCGMCLPPATQMVVSLDGAEDTTRA